MRSVPFVPPEKPLLPVFVRVVAALGDELTQVVAAQRIGTTQPTLNRWINSGAVPDLRHAMAVARLVGMSLDALVAPSEEEAERIERAQLIVRQVTASLAAPAAPIANVRYLPSAQPEVTSIAASDWKRSPPKAPEKQDDVLVAIEHARQASSGGVPSSDARSGDGRTARKRPTKPGKGGG